MLGSQSCLFFFFSFYIEMHLMSLRERCEVNTRCILLKRHDAAGDGSSKTQRLPAPAMCLKYVEFISTVISFVPSQVWSRIRSLRPPLAALNLPKSLGHEPRKKDRLHLFSRPASENVPTVLVQALQSLHPVLIKHVYVSCPVGGLLTQLLKPRESCITGPVEKEDSYFLLCIATTCVGSP